MEDTQDIFSFIKAQETAYALPITVIEGYDWSMKDHIRKTVLYKNGKFWTGADDGERPSKNIVLPIMRLQYRTEGYDVKDVDLYVDSNEEYYKSFLVQQYHEDFAAEFELDEFIDEKVETYCDFGGVLVKDINQPSPDVVPWETVAFCDQTDFLSSPFGFRNYYSPSQILKMAPRHWGDAAYGADVTLEELTILASTKKSPDQDSSKKNDTPGQQIEVYDVYGDMPESWLREDGAAGKYVLQMQIVAYYKNDNGEREHVTLFKAKLNELPFKLKLRDPIHGRALGIGGVEELFEPQTWVRYSDIALKDLLDAASKVVLLTNDPGFAERHPSGLKDLDNLEVVEIAEGKEVSQLDTRPVNFSLFEQKATEWTQHAQLMGGAPDPVLGESPSAGTPFKLQDLVVTEAHGIHDYRQGKLVAFMATIYRDWILPFITKEITAGKEFLSSLSLDQLTAVADNLVLVKANEVQKERILSGQLPLTDEEVEKLKTKTREQFMRGGNNRFIKILKDELKDVPLRVRVNIAGKQKDLNKITDKLVNIFRQIIATPQVLDDPRMMKLFNEILEASGLSPIDFYQRPKPAAAALPAATLPAPRVPTNLPSQSAPLTAQPA